MSRVHLLGELGGDAGQIEAAAERVQACRVLVGDGEERRAQRGPPAQPQDDHRRVGVARVGQPPFERLRAGVEQAAVRVEQRDVARPQGGRGGSLLEAIVGP